MFLLIRTNWITLNSISLLLFFPSSTFRLKIMVIYQLIKVTEEPIEHSGQVVGQMDKLFQRLRYSIKL